MTCVAMRCRVVAVTDAQTALVDDRGRTVSVALLALDEPIEPGDWLLVHSGIAIARVNSPDVIGRSHNTDIKEVQQ